MLAIYLNSGRQLKEKTNQRQSKPLFSNQLIEIRSQVGSIIHYAALTFFCLTSLV
jgi:hypothetical protein